ncbi:MAG: bifunctional hydroxymethylpyrimidine kinase/phosphomethylpyrimidine kinase [Candidatus Altiarchaeia archaeon]
MKKALTIAGSDSGGGAGIQQDQKVFSSIGVHGTTVITSVTAQNTVGVQDYAVLAPETIAAQIDSVFSDIRPDAMKTGMLANTEVISVVRKSLKKYKASNLVIDPVMVSTSGHRLLEEDAIESLRKLFPLAVLVTPNIPEAEILSGIKIHSRSDMKKAAEKIGDCVVKGGHLDAVDVLHYKGEFSMFEGSGLVDEKIHGAGCAFSAAIAAYLAKEYPVPAAVRKAKEYVDQAINRNMAVGRGARILDTGNIKLGRTYAEKKKAEVIENLEEAVAKFVSDENSFKLIPQVGANIVMALPDAENVSGIAGLTGRLIRDRDCVVPVGWIDYGASTTTGRVLLTARRHDRKIRAAMVLRFGEDVITACLKAKLSAVEFERDAQKPDGETIEYGTDYAIKSYKKAPDIVYDRGGMKKEAVVRVFGTDAINVVEKALLISRNI